MDIADLFLWMQKNFLALIAVLITLILLYHYFAERGSGLKLSKKYRGSIFEAQSRIFLNATQYLISGNKDLAIREFLNAVDLNKETLETYFALGRLFRSNGQIEKAISIHRSLIAREHINESTRIEALKELAIDFDKGGFVDKAVDTYQDVLRLDRDQTDVLRSLCRIYENTADWDKAYQYRLILSKSVSENQSETISHILIEKAKKEFWEGAYKEANEKLDEAFKFAPSISAKILNIKLHLVKGLTEEAKELLMDVLLEAPYYIAFVFSSLEEFNAKLADFEDYQMRLNYLKDFFLKIENQNLEKSPAFVVSKIRLLKKQGLLKQAQEVIENWIKQGQNNNEVLSLEYIKLLIERGENDLALQQTKELLSKMNKTMTQYFCKQCGFDSDDVFWRCPQCYEWETIDFRWKV